MLLHAFLHGCGDDSPKTAAQLVLTTDPEVCSRADLLAQVAALQVIVDADQGGLQGVDRPGAREGGGTAVDWDGDGKLEVIFKLDYASLPDGELPVLEIGLEGNTDRKLEFRVLGFRTSADSKPDQAVAMGGVSASCPQGDLCQIGIPFNLRSSARPPRVVVVLPADGAVVPTNLVAVSVMFSTLVEEKTLQGNVSIVDPDGSPVAATLSLESLVYPAVMNVQESRSLLQIQNEPFIKDGQYEIRVSPGIESTTGLPFDQDPSTPAADPFVSRFRFEALSGGGGCVECPEGFECDDKLGGCVPMKRCDAGCIKGFVCEPTSGLCVEDCRPYGVCASPTSRCEMASGLCVDK